MKDLKTIESRVRAILSNHQEARDDDMMQYKILIYVGMKYNLLSTL